MPVRSLQGRVKWAIAGRNQAKLESVRKHVAELNPACKVCCCSSPQQIVLATNVGHQSAPPRFKLPTGRAY